MSNAQLSGLPAGNWMLMPAPRVRPLERERAPRLARVMLAIVRRAGRARETYNAFATLARLGRILAAADSSPGNTGRAGFGEMHAPT